jgi:hypothetical protein
VCGALAVRRCRWPVLCVASVDGGGERGPVQELPGGVHLCHWHWRSSHPNPSIAPPVHSPCACPRPHWQSSSAVPMTGGGPPRKGLDSFHFSPPTCQSSGGDSAAPRLPPVLCSLRPSLRLLSRAQPSSSSAPSRRRCGERRLRRGPIDSPLPNVRSAVDGASLVRCCPCACVRRQVAAVECAGVQ